MGKYAYGISKFEVGDIAAADGTIENPDNLTHVIYKDTITIDEPEATETNHFVEGKKSPVVSLNQGGVQTVMANLFGATPAQKVSLMGGEEIALDTLATYAAPSENVSIEKYLKITFKSGHVLQLPRVKVTGRLTGEVKENGVIVNPVKFTVLEPSFDALKPYMLSEPV